MYLSPFVLTLAALQVVSGRQLTEVTKTKNTLVFQSKSSFDEAYFSFSLYNNVLTIQANDTLTNLSFAVDSPSVRFMVQPQLLVEAVPGSSRSVSIWGFLDKATPNWGTGFKVDKSEAPTADGMLADIYRISANWTSFEGPTMLFEFYLTSAETEFNGMQLNPNAIFMLYSIINYPWVAMDSYLGLQQILLSKQGFRRSLCRRNDFVTKYGALNIGHQADVDGVYQKVVSQISQSPVDPIIVGNSTRIDTTGLKSQYLWMNVTNSNAATLITLRQELRLDFDGMHMDNGLEERASK